MVNNNNHLNTSEKTFHLHPINAYILIRIQGGNLNYLLENTKRLKQVKSTAIVAGDYDVVMRVSTPNLEQLLNVTDNIQYIHGIQQTLTHIIEKEVSP